MEVADSALVLFELLVAEAVFGFAESTGVGLFLVAKDAFGLVTEGVGVRLGRDEARSLREGELLFRGGVVYNRSLSDDVSHAVRGTVKSGRDTKYEDKFDLDYNARKEDRLLFAVL